MIFYKYSIYYSGKTVNVQIAFFYGQIDDVIVTKTEDKMQNQSYSQSLSGETDDVCDESVPIRVNSAGYIRLNYTFRTNRKRRDYYLQLMHSGILEDGDGNPWLHTGQFIIHSPEKYTKYGHVMDQTRDGGYFWIHFTGSYVKTLLCELGIECDTIYELKDAGMIGGLEQEFSALFREFMLKQKGYAQITIAQFLDVLVKLSRGISSNGQERKNRLKKSVEYIHFHYTEDLRVSDLSEMEHFSESRYRELFRELYGCSPTEYIIRIRMGYASEYLVTTEYSVTEISEMCGYRDVLYFIRLFRRRFGVSPGAYRRTMK